MNALTIQKDIVKAYALEAVEAIRRDMGDDYFAFLVDESRDVSIKEQMVMAVGYVDKRGRILERVIGFVHVAETTSITLKEAIETLFSTNNLSLSKLCGQGFDGASNMRGEYNGLKSLILQENNLKLLRIIEVDGITLDSRKKAESLAYSMDNFDFVFKLHMTRKVLGITKTLSKALQKKDQDIVNAMNNVNLCKIRFKTLRGSGWDDLLFEVKSFCEKNKIYIPNLDDTYAPLGRSRRRIDITGKHYYCHELFYEVIAHQAKEFDDYFPELATELISCVGCISSTKSFSAFDKRKLLQLAKFYEADFFSMDLLVLDDQLDMYYLEITINIQFSEFDEIRKLSIKMVETEKLLVYPQVYRLITFALILRVATATVEIAFSAMKFVKTEARNRMSDGWMSDSLLTFIERYIFLDIDTKTVAKRFQNMRPRRYQLPLDY